MNTFKTLTIVLLAFIAGGAAMYMLLPSGTQAELAAKEKQPLYWVAPMDSNYRRDQPGQSPMGMDLIPVYEESNAGDDAGVVRISPVVENNLGVKIDKVTQEDLSLQINTVGFIGFNEDSVTHFHSRVDGWIEKLSVTAVGDPVDKGQKLFELYSPELVNAQEEYLIAFRGSNTQLLNAAQRKLEALGVDEKQIAVLRKEGKVNQRLTFNAQISGYVANLNVREGSFLKPDKNVMSVGALDSVWVIAEIFERQAGWVKPGQTVEMTTDSYPGKTWRGVVNYLYPVLNSQTRTLKARVVFENPDEQLKPNMFTELLIEAGVKLEALSVPREAVIRSGGISRVVKALGDGRFKAVLVKTGIESGQRTEITQGLQAGDDVVVSSQFLIDSESNLSGELNRMEEATMPERESKVAATGIVHKLMENHRMITVSHDPIVEWGWPSMKMDFSIAENVDISSLSADQYIEFDISRNDQDDYLVTAIRSADKGSSADHKQHEMSRQKQIRTRGVIKQVMSDMNMLNITHEPIPEWQWPAMTMMFEVSDSIDLQTLQASQEIEFQLLETAEGDYVVTALYESKTESKTR